MKKHSGISWDQGEKSQGSQGLALPPEISFCCNMVEYSVFVTQTDSTDNVIVIHWAAALSRYQLIPLSCGLVFITVILNKTVVLSKDIRCAVRD